MNYQDENAYKGGLKTGFYEGEGPAPDVLYEKGKAFLCRVLFVFSIIGMIGVSQITDEKNVDYTGLSGLLRAFAIKNSHFLDTFQNNILTIEAYKVLLLIALFLLAVCALVNAGTERRSKKYIIKKNKIEREIAADDRIRFENDESTKKLRRMENAKRASNIFLFFLTIAVVLMFVVIFALSGFSYVIREMSKDEIDRTISDFRLIMNLISSLCQTLGICFGVSILPFVVRNRTILSEVIIKIFCVISAFATLHHIYFFFGHFTSYPSFLDFSFAVICGSMAGFCALAIATEKKKKILREFSNSRFNIF